MMSFSEVEKLALALSADDRESLVTSLLESLKEPDNGLSWLEVAERRYAAYKALEQARVAALDQAGK